MKINLIDAKENSDYDPSENSTPDYKIGEPVENYDSIVENVKTQLAIIELYRHCKNQNKNQNKGNYF
jgi:hypothetical protein